jgi:iron complex outermembrane receptor protein
MDRDSLKRRPAGIAGFLLVALCASGYGQDNPTTGRVGGVLKDATGAVVPAATIEILGLEPPLARSTLSDREGRYALDRLPPGRYAISAVAPGLERSVIEDVVVVAGAETQADFKLDVARSLAFVEVTAPASVRPLAIETDPRTPRQPIPAHDGADYLKTIPGFSVIRKGGTDGDPVLRGMAGSRLGLLLDGQNVLGGCGNRMDPPTAYTFPEAYDRITVLKGPQSVLYGPGNSAGVVLFERERQRYLGPGFHAYVSPTLGNFGRNDEVAEVRAGIRSGYVQASATRSAMDGYQDGGGQAVHSLYQRWSANAALGWTPDDLTSVELSGARSDGEAAYADRMMDGVRFSRDNLGLRLERRNISRTLQNLEGQLYYNYVDHVMDNYSLRPFDASMMMPQPAASNPDRRTEGGRLAAAVELGAITHATVGGDWQGNRHTIRKSSNQASDPFETHVRVRDADFENLGAFAELTQGAGSKGRVVAGVRVDWWTGQDERATIAVGTGPGSARPNPTAGMRRRETLPSGFARYERVVGAATTLYAGVGHVQRAPDYWELISKESASSLSAFETRPEKVTQLDAGVQYRHGAVSGSVAVFVNGISGFILIESNYAKPIAATGVGTTSGGMSGGMAGGTSERTATITRNVDASSWGGEVTATLEATKRLKIDTSLAYVRGQNRTDDRPLAQLPPLEGRLGLQYQADRWSIGALTRLVAAQDRYALNQGNIVGQDLGPTASFGVFSLNGVWCVTRRAHLTAGIDNLFDTTYAEFVSRSGANVPGFTTTTRVNEPGRTVWIKLALRY